MRRWKIAAAVVTLAALIAIVNYAFNMDPSQLAARGIGRDAHDHGEEEPEEAASTASSGQYDPIGPQDAPVLIEVFEFRNEATCATTWQAVSRVAQAYQPHVRVELRNLEDEAISKRAKQLPLRGGRGLAVNGKVIMDVPEAGGFGMVVLLGGPYDLKWNEPILHKVIEHELKSKGVAFTPPPLEAPAAAEEHAHTHDHEHDHSH